MEDREFFDHLRQVWSKTTGAEFKFWMPEEDTTHHAWGPGTFNIYTVDKDQKREFIAAFEHEVDADFITAVHGCLPDLIRRLWESMDEADRLDHERDSQECRIAELEIEVDAQAAEIIRLKRGVSDG